MVIMMMRMTLQMHYESYYINELLFDIILATTGPYNENYEFITTK